MVDVLADDFAARSRASSANNNSRCIHANTVVSAKGYIPVITHLFDSESPYLKNDVVFGVRESLIADMKNGKCHYDFVLDPL